ncbi:unnamed protein product [Fasciola hepatica]|uniref:Uncharacterized protein n=1 Tax=Fasciola hepatica TaxID=6192 RepID=A0ABC9HGC0_FASHE|nr:unnamed protein product [Fasciola hepatica]
MGLIFQSNSPQPYHLEAIAEELAQIGDEFYQEFEYAEEPFSAHEFLQLLNEVTQRRGSSTNNIEIKIWDYCQIFCRIFPVRWANSSLVLLSDAMTDLFTPNGDRSMARLYADHARKRAVDRAVMMIRKTEEMISVPRGYAAPKLILYGSNLVPFPLTEPLPSSSHGHLGRRPAFYIRKR